ncbi:WD40/YVTN/BNR-like repeat-containing protein [Sphingomonas citri]
MRIRSAAMLLASLIALPVNVLAAPTRPYAWRNVTVGGGGFAPGIVFSRAERGLAYLRTDMGGAYRWDAAGGRWVPLQDDVAEASYMGVESVAPDPVDADLVYLAVGMGARGPAAILRSSDRGTHWRTTPVPFAMGGNEDGRGLGERLAIDPDARATLFFGSRHDGLWRSDDSAATWHKVAAFPLAGLGRPDRPRTTHGGLSFVLFDPAHRGRMFVGSTDPGEHHLFRSDDGGATWRAVSGGPRAALLPVKAAVGGDGVVTLSYSDAIGPNGVKDGAVWRYDPDAGTWRDLTPPRAAGEVPGGFFGVAVSAQDPRVIAVSTVNRYQPVDTVWRSTDAGAHWDELWRRSTRDVGVTPFLDFDGRANFGHWIAGLAIDPFDPAHAAYVTGATVYATDDFSRPGTMRWRPWTRGIEQTAIITLVSPTGGAPLVSGFGDLGGFRHADLTRSPAHVHRTPFLTNTNSLDYAGAAPLVLVRSGNTHKPVVPDTSLAWSQDGGEVWAPLRLPASETIPRADGTPARAQTGSAAITVSADGATFLVESDRPLLTRDRGATWRAVAGLPVGARVTADKVDPKRFYAVDAGRGRLLRSDDGGASFAPAAGQGLPADLSGARAVGREAANPLVAVPGRAGALWLLAAGTLYHSEDAGEHWTRADGAARIDRYGLGKAAPGSIWPALYAIATVDGTRGIYRSTDGGARWVQINDAAHRWGLRLRVISGNPRRYGRVYVGTDGRGIMYGDPKGEGE